MYVAHHQIAESDVEDQAPEVERFARAVPKPYIEMSSIPPSRYESTRRRPAILLVLAVHLLAIFALVKLDVLHIAPKRHDAVMVDLRPLDQAPPPRAEPARERTPKIDTPIVASSPIVTTPVVAAPVATVPVAPSPAPPAPQPAAPVAAAPVAAPILPPDASAATLGNVAPRYPVESRRAREEGTVRLRVLISPEGSVEEIAVARSSGFDRLDKAALETVRKWRFRPGTQAGTPVEAVGYLSIPFVLAH